MSIAAMIKTEEALDRALVSLEEEPLWHASLGSKELFHSNLIAWVARRFPGQTAHVFGHWLTPRPGEPAQPPLREKRHLDIVLRFKDRAPLVIENKMFSMPRDEQLVGYTHTAIPAMGLIDPSLVLLSLVEPDWADEGLVLGGHTWGWMSYAALAAGLAEEFPADNPTFDETVVRHYSGMVADLQTVVDRVKLNDFTERLPAPSFLSSDLGTKLGRLTEIASKLRADQLRRRIAQELDRLGLQGRLVESNFSVGMPLIDWTTSRDVGANSMGWQYQAGQWRLSFNLRAQGLAGVGNKAAREQHSKSHDDWFNFGLFGEITGLSEAVPAREAAGGFNHFDPDFIYRYRKLTNPTAEQVVRLAVAYSQAAGRLTR